MCNGCSTAKQRSDPNGCQRSRCESERETENVCGSHNTARVIDRSGKDKLYSRAVRTEMKTPVLYNGPFEGGVRLTSG